MISKLERQSAAVLEAPYNELAVAVHHAEVTNIDETSWRERRLKALVVGDGDPLCSRSSPSPRAAAVTSPRRSWGAKTVRSSAATGSARMSGSWRGGDRSAGRTCGAIFRR